MYDKHSPIGVLDSGIGGFSVARQLQGFCRERTCCILVTEPIFLMGTTPKTEL